MKYNKAPKCTCGGSPIGLGHGGCYWIACQCCKNGTKTYNEKEEAEKEWLEKEKEHEL